MLHYVVVTSIRVKRLQLGEAEYGFSVLWPSQAKEMGLDRLAERIYRISLALWEQLEGLLFLREKKNMRKYEFLLKWQLAFRVGAMSLLLAGVKFAFVYFGLELFNVNPFLPSLLAGTKAAGWFIVQLKKGIQRLSGRQFHFQSEDRQRSCRHRIVHVCFRLPAFGN